MGVEEGAEGGDVAVVDVVELESWAYGALVSVVALSEELDAVEDGLEGVAQVIDDDDVVAGSEEFEGGVGADEAKPASDQDILVVQGQIVEAVVEGFIEED